MAGLLAAGDVGLHRQPALSEPDGPGEGRPGEHVAVGEAEGARGGDRPAEPEHDALRPVQLVEYVDEVAQMRPPRRRVELEHHRAGVPVGDQPGQAVVLTVHEPVGVGVGVRGECRPAVERGRQPAAPEVVVDRQRRS